MRKRTNIKVVRRTLPKSTHLIDFLGELLENEDERLAIYLKGEVLIQTLSFPGYVTVNTMLPFGDITQNVFKLTLGLSANTKITLCTTSGGTDFQIEKISSKDVNYEYKAHVDFFKCQKRYEIHAE